MKPVLETPASMLRIVTVVSAVLFSVTSFSQGHQRQLRDVFPTFGNYEREGWMFNAGLTYTAPWFRETSDLLQMSEDSLYNMEYRANGRMGVAFEMGRFFSLKGTSLVKYIDFTFGYKLFRGVEEFEATLYDESPNPYTLRGDGVFNQGYLSLALNFNNYTQFSDFGFVQNSLGVNADYRINASQTYNDRGLYLNTSMPVGAQMQIHYKLGVGFRVSQNIIVVPTVETPVFTVYEFDNFRSSFPTFSSRYRPLIFRLQVLLMDPKAKRKCPTGPKGKSKETLFGAMGGGKQPW